MFVLLPLLTLLVAVAGCGGESRVAEPEASGDRPVAGPESAAVAPLKPGEIPPQVWWKDPANVAAMSLDAEQLAALEPLDREYFDELRILRRQERRAYARFLSALRINTEGGEQIEKSSAAFAEVRNRRQELLNRRLVELRQILDLEQWTMLKEVAPGVLQIGLFQPFATTDPLRITDEWPPEDDGAQTDAGKSGE